MNVFSRLQAQRAFAYQCLFKGSLRGTLAPCALALAVALAGCQQSKKPPEPQRGPVVAGLTTQPTFAPASDAARRLAAEKERLGAANSQAGGGAANSQAGGGAANSQAGGDAAIVAHVKLTKSYLLNRNFLYSSDLQYSSSGDAKLAVTLQAQANPLLRARFRIVDDRLQLAASSSHEVESDINAPERLVHEFPILAQDEATVTISLREASPILASALAGPDAAAPRQTWVRSASVDAAGDYVLFETSLEMADGSIAEFMESFFPRDVAIDPEAKPFFDDPSLEPLARRFRFISDSDVWLKIAGKGKGKTRTKIAARAAWKRDRPIEWWVTPNIPDEFLPVVKMGVEGWNRYSRAMWGVDIVAFKGRLPAGAKIGDPRLNVIDFDSVSEAGAAYESQAADPLTGAQTHSLIYLPLAWAKIGEEFWRAGSLSESAIASTRELQNAFARGRFMDRPLAVRCLQDALETIPLSARTTPEEFARSLMKSVVFHEMGHALGLSHNFKGSLSMDPADSATPFTSSIMDYMPYHLAVLAFDSVDSAAGPLLEYDRQALSALYNEGKDIKPSDPVLPACADQESDDRSAGVDPLCIRYDMGRDPTVAVIGAIALATRGNDAKHRGERSLLEALQGLASELPNPATITDADKARAGAGKTIFLAAGLVNYYFSTGAQSVANLARVNARSLRVFSNSLPDGYDEAGMRDRAYRALQFVAAAESFDPAVSQAIENLGPLTLAWMAETPYAAGLPEADREKQAAGLSQAFAGLSARLAKMALGRMRATVWGELARVPTAPFFLAINGDATRDFEQAALDVLEKAVSTPVAGEARALVERLKAAASLKSYVDVSGGAAAIQRCQTRLLQEADRARNAIARENARSVLKALAK